MPEWQRTRFMRYQLAGMVESEADRLRDYTYDKLTLLKWVKRSASRAESDAAEVRAR